MTKTKVFLVCSGLGNAKRGFESFTQECFAALSQESSLHLTLFKGGGKTEANSITLPNIPRDTWAAKQIAKLIGREGYLVEQASFVLSLLPHIQLKQPDVIYFSDGNIGNILWHWRRLTRQNYKLLFSNGGPLSPPFCRWDLVQQVTPTYYRAALAAGESEVKQTLVPYGIEAESEIVLDLKRKELREQLGLPRDRPVILSVGAINKSHKRMDYVIREIASLPQPLPYLLLLGQQQSESAEIIAMGDRLLGANNFQVKTVAFQEVPNYYQAADLFVLASLTEGFGRVFLEAMAHGLPCLAHDYEVARFVLGEEGYFANFAAKGSLAELVNRVLAESDKDYKRDLRYQSIYKRFSWKQLLPSYVQMIESCACI